MNKAETKYVEQLKASDYDFLEVVRSEDGYGRITIKFMETRWRTVDETVSMLQEVIEKLKLLPPADKKW